MRERALQQQQQAQQELNTYIRQTAEGGSAADELTKLAKLHDDKKQALFEYRKYLELEPDAKDAGQVRDIIAAMGE